ncbi:conjugal transfer protein TraD, partial [Pseudomonas sp. FW306-2-11AA]
RAAIFGLLIEAAARLPCDDQEQILVLWRRRGIRAFGDMFETSAADKNVPQTRA